MMRNAWQKVLNADEQRFRTLINKCIDVEAYNQSRRDEYQKYKDYYTDKNRNYVLTPEQRIKYLESSKHYRLANYEEIMLLRGIRERIARKIKYTKFLWDLKGGFPTCERCGESNIEALVADHIDGFGYVEFKLHGNSFKYYSKMINEARRKLQILCENCNFLKRLENQENGWVYYGNNKYNPKRVIINLHKRVRERLTNKMERVNFLWQLADGFPQCVWCGKTNIEILVVDHINGGGNNEATIKFNDRGAMMRYYYKHIDVAKQKLQILCHTCNKLKQKRFEEYHTVH